MPLGPADLDRPVVTALPSTVGLRDGAEVLYKTGSGDDALLWPLKYDSLITDAYKWRVIGRPAPLEFFGVANSGGGQVGTTSYAPIAGMTTTSLTIPLAGVYDFEVSGSGQQNVPGTSVDWNLAAFIDGSQATHEYAGWGFTSGTPQKINTHARQRVTVSPAGATVNIRVKNSTTTGTPTWYYMRLAAFPVRVG